MEHTIPLYERKCSRYMNVSARNLHSKVSCLAATVASRRPTWLPESSTSLLGAANVLSFENRIVSSAGKEVSWRT